MLSMSTEIKVLEADMLDLPFEDGCFDVVIEKGTMVLLEVLFCMYYLVQQTANHFSFSNDQLIICKFLNFIYIV